MKTLFIILVFFTFAIVVKLINKEERIVIKTKDDVNLIFSKIHKSNLNTL